MSLPEERLTSSQIIELHEAVKHALAADFWSVATVPAFVTVQEFHDCCEREKAERAARSERERRRSWFLSTPLRKEAEDRCIPRRRPTETGVVLPHPVVSEMSRVIPVDTLTGDDDAAEIVIPNSGVVAVESEACRRFRAKLRGADPHMVVPAEPGMTFDDVCRISSEEQARYKANKSVLPTGSQERKDTPVYSGVMAYFPRALAYIAQVSKAGNDKHNPGEPLHWAKEKSTDHADCVARHLIEHGTFDPEDNLRHSGKLAWRSLALLETELEEAAEEAAKL